jgi:hypothetical protein
MMRYRCEDCYCEYYIIPEWELPFPYTCPVENVYGEKCGGKLLIISDSPLDRLNAIRMRAKGLGYNFERVFGDWLSEIEKNLDDITA